MGETPVPVDVQFTSVPVAEQLTLAGVFAHATIPVQVVLWGLVAASLTALVLWGMQAMQLRRRHAGGQAAALAYLSALAAAGPLIGFVGTAYALMNGFIGVANVRPTPSLTVLAPGLAEATLSAGLGLLAAAIGVIGHRHLKAGLHGLEARDAASSSHREPPIAQRVRTTA
jgi:biopolymer transport protein ExbB/TolQ